MPTFARDFIRTIEYTWYYAPIEYKVKLQRAIFPEGLKYHFTGFSNSKISRPFKLINEVVTKKSNDVNRVGFEPTTKNLRGSCSTTELPVHQRARRELNPQPRDPKSRALSIKLRAPILTMHILTSFAVCSKKLGL